MFPMTLLFRIGTRLLALAGLLLVTGLLFSHQEGSLSTRPVSAASGGPEMALTITTDGFCTGSACYAEAGQNFTLGVDFVEVPAVGFAFVQTHIDYGGLTYSPAADPADEVKWVVDPNQQPPTGPFDTFRDEFGPGLVTHASLTSFFPPMPHSTFEGIAVELAMTCTPAPSSTAVSLLPDGPVTLTSGSKYGSLDAALVQTTYIPKLSSITVNCVSPQVHPGDTDGDGCSDAAESGLDETLGGGRDWLNPWDYYDVAGPGEGPPDGFVDLFADIVGVVHHYAPTGAEPEYDVSFDRGPSAGPNPWNMTAPDGKIDLFVDILGAMNQNFHDCR